MSTEPNNRDQFKKKRRWSCRRTSAVICSVITILAIFTWLERKELLHQLALIWTVNDSPTHLDAIVILGGGEQSRPFRAAELYHAGLAPVILIPKINLLPTEQLSITTSSNEVNRHVLLSQGVPEATIQLIGNGEVKNTHDEAAKVAEWIKAHQAHSVIVPTDPFHTQRCLWIFQRTLGSTDAQVAVVSVPGPVSASNWWTSEEGVIQFESEVCKMIYYRLRY